MSFDSFIPAKVFDLKRKKMNIEKDALFYVEHIGKPPSDILELGCGTGRISLLLAEKGYYVTGIDISNSMLKIAEQNIRNAKTEVRKRVSCIYGDMRNFSIKKSFDAAIMPGSSFHFLIKREDQTKCLQCVHDHIKERGILIMDLFNPDRNEPSRVLKHSSTDVIEETGEVVSRFSAQDFDYRNQLIDVHYFTDYLTKDGSIRREISSVTLCYFTPVQIRTLLSQNDFVVKHLYGSFDSDKFHRCSNKMIVVSHRL